MSIEPQLAPEVLPELMLFPDVKLIDIASSAGSLLKDVSHHAIYEGTWKFPDAISPPYWVAPLPESTPITPVVS